ncbi:MAG TPA: DUF4397 domain-containing protein [Actinomycetes bacterium]|nr:DUF4397 domain-containing protein [Actinomycetes bacterium]
MRSLRSTALIGAALLLAPAAVLVAAGPAGAASNDAKVSVFHGIPGVDVNVYVNGKITLKDFKPGAMAGPLSLPAGTYKVEVTSYKADKAAGKKTADVIGPANIPVAAGHNYTIAAHLTTAGKPTATVFDNDISGLAAGKGRVTVAHVADAPTVAITANGATLIKSLSNPESASAVVPAATYKVGVVAGGKTVFSTSLPVAAGANTIVFAYGTYPSTFAVAVQKITGLGAAPTGVPAGEAGLAHDGSSFPDWAIGGMVLAGIGAVVAGRRVLVGSRQD